MIPSLTTAGDANLTLGRQHARPPDGGGTQYHPLSAANAKNRVGNAHGGPKRRLSTCAHYTRAMFQCMSHLSLLPSPQFTQMLGRGSEMKNCTLYIPPHRVDMMLQVGVLTI